jgi:hypothetical protein
MAQRQFKSTDTSKWVYGFGNGSDGVYSSSGNATDAPTDSACTGNAGDTSLSATNASFAIGQCILIHQTKGTGVGNWELNKINGYTAGTITTAHTLMNTYATGAQVLVLKQYSSFTQNSGHTLTAKTWNGTVGGIIAFLCSGTTTITGTLTSYMTGALGGTGGGVGATNGGNGAVSGSGGGGGGQYNSSVGSAGSASGNAALTSLVIGSGGGAGSGYNGTQAHMRGGGGGGNGAAGSAGQGDSGQPGGDGYAAQNGSTGGAGGGGIIIITKNLAEITGAITLTGGNQVLIGDVICACGGGGSGGSCLIKCETAILGTNKITAAGGIGSNRSSLNQSIGGDGSVGRIHVDYKTSCTGTTNPTLDSTQDTTLKYSGGFVSSFML